MSLSHYETAAKPLRCIQIPTTQPTPSRRASSQPSSGAIHAATAGANPDALLDASKARSLPERLKAFSKLSPRDLLPVPPALTMVEAAAMPETLFTVWVNLVRLGGATRGDRALVHGGTSGIGTMAIMLGKAFGLTVIATAGSDEKCRACEALGAERAINYREQDFGEVREDDVAPGCIRRGLCQCVTQHVVEPVAGGVLAQIHAQDTRQPREHGFQQFAIAG